jgi:hypothetical protein
MRLSWYSVVVIVCLSTLASADLKIKTRTTVMGHTTESTVYIKGSRERSEMSYGGQGGIVTLMQCDQKRMITISGDQCMVMPMGGGEASCPVMPNMKAMGRQMAGEEPTLPRKGGVVTITRTSTDTGERQDIFGYKARHIKSSMVMESTPDACNQSHMKMEMDGWYADLSAGFSCGDESYRGLACGGARKGCTDRIVVKGGGSGTLGYPLKQTTTITSDQGTFTTTTEVLELTNTSLDAPLFDMPPGCKAMDMSAMMGGPPANTASTAAPEPAAAPPPAAATPAAPPAASAPAAAPKAAGVLRIGVVKIKDMSGQSLPVDSLRLNLISEIARHQLEAVPLDAETPQDVEAEARSKECDYFVFTVPTEVKEPGSGGLSSGSVPKGVILDPAKFQALTEITLYKVGKPTAEMKNLPLAADAGQFAVDAVTNTFVQESDKIAQQIAEDAHPKPASKAAKPPARKSTGSAKPN